MIKPETLTDALECIAKHENTLVGQCIRGITSGNVPDTEIVLYRDILSDMLETRGHIYDLLAGVSTPSNFLGDMTGAELVQHFAEIPMGED